RTFRAKEVRSASDPKQTLEPRKLRVGVFARATSSAHLTVYPATPDPPPRQRRRSSLSSSVDRPQSRRGKLHKVTVGIAEIEAPAPPWALPLSLYLYAVRVCAIF